MIKAVEHGVQTGAVRARVARGGGGAHSGFGVAHGVPLMAWEQPNLSPAERWRAYRQHLGRQLQDTSYLGGADRGGETRREATMLIAPRFVAHLESELRWVGRCSSGADFVSELQRRTAEGVVAAIGRNRLGATEWRIAFGVDVENEPPLPHKLLQALHSPCPIRAGKSVAAGHLLVFLPASVDGEPFSAGRLAQLCRNAEIPQIFAQEDRWQQLLFASTPNLKGRWVLVPQPPGLGEEAGLAENRLRPYQQLYNRPIVQQTRIHQESFPEYRQASALELLSALVLNRLVNGEWFHEFDAVRCRDINVRRGTVCIGDCHHDGVRIKPLLGPEAYSAIGRALVRDVG